MSKTWFVTGAAGFIGSHLCAQLLAGGARVIGFDDFSTGNRVNVDRAAAVAPAAFEMIEGDIRDRGAVDAAISSADVVVHLAAQVSVPASFVDPIVSDSINVGGFLNVLTAAGEAMAATFVFASSCAVYGDNPALPLNEDARPRPMSPYAVSKLSNEYYARALAPSYPATRMVGLRLFNVFGPWQNAEGGYASVIPRWLALCAGGNRPDVYGDGTATRDFCYVGDVANFIETVGTSDAPVNAVYNVGSGTATDLMELFAIISKTLRRHGVDLDFASPAIKPDRPGDILHSYADVSRAAADLGCRAAVSIEQGITKIVETQFADPCPSDPSLPATH